MASAHYWLLLRAEAKSRNPSPGTVGRLSRLIAELSPAARRELVAPHPDVIEVLDFREYAPTSAEVAHEFDWNWLVADLVGAAVHYRATLCFGSGRNVPPVIKGSGGRQPLVTYRVLEHGDRSTLAHDPRGS